MVVSLPRFKVICETSTDTQWKTSVGVSFCLNCRTLQGYGTPMNSRSGSYEFGAIIGKFCRKTAKRKFCQKSEVSPGSAPP
jgi:hypothetical protein